MNPFPESPVANEVTDLPTTNKPVSSLRRDIDKRKAKKDRRMTERLPSVQHATPAEWGEIHPLVDNLHGLLVEFGRIGVMGQQAITLIPEEKQPAFIENVDVLFNDVTNFTNRLRSLKFKVKEAEVIVTADDYMDYLDIYMKLDELRVDIQTVLTPPALAITEEVSHYNNLRMENKDAA